MIIPIGATVRITKKSHWAFNKRVKVTSLPTIEIAGLDLGELVAFQAVNYFGEIDEHVIGRHECEQVEAAIVPMLKAGKQEREERAPVEAGQQMSLFA